jgi:hypothetical protein
VAANAEPETSMAAARSKCFFIGLSLFLNVLIHGLRAGRTVILPDLPLLYL